MPTFFRMSEILACSLADYLPYLLLVVYPFRNHTRLKSFLAGVLALVMTAAVLRYDLSCALLGTPPTVLPFPLLRSAALGAFALLVLHVHIGKNLLSTLSVINISILISTLTDRFAADYTAKHLIVTLLLQALLLIPYTLNLIYVQAPSMNESDDPAWKLLFVAPAAGTALGCILLLKGAASLPAVMAAALAFSAAAAALTLCLTGKETMTMIFKKDRPVKQNISPVTAVPREDPAQAYLAALQSRILEAEIGSKELLLQVMTMEDDLNGGSYEQLREKLAHMRKQLAPQITPTGNPRIDSLLTHHTRQAMLSSVKMAVNVTLPELCSVTDEDLTVLLGCLLDCALESCREQTSGTRRIAVASHLDDDLLQIGIKHTCASPTDTDCESLSICRSVASRYEGKVNVVDMQGVAQIVVMLHI